MKPPESKLWWAAYCVAMVLLVWFGLFLDGLYHSMRWGH